MKKKALTAINGLQIHRLNATQVRILALPTIIWGDREVVKPNGQKKNKSCLHSTEKFDIFKKICYNIYIS